MTTYAEDRSTTAPSWPPFAAASAAVSLVLTAIGTFWSPLSKYASQATTRDDVISWLVVAGIIAVAAALVFGLVVRTATPENASARGLVLSIVGAASIVVFWAGLPVVLAGAAACCALTGTGTSTRDRITLALAALTSAAAVWLALAG